MGDHQRAISSCYPGAWNDESEKIDELAEILQIEVEKVFPAEEDISSALRDIVFATEEPFPGTMPIAQFLMMRRAREIGIAVTLNGHGPDEMFAGYPARHCSFVAAECFRRGDWRQLREELSGMRKLHGVPASDFFYTLLKIHSPASAQLARNLMTSGRRRLFHPDAFRDYGSAESRFHDSQTFGTTPLDRRLRREFFSEIVPRYLAYEDRTSMHSSVESRVPFLDHRIVEFAFSLNDSDKISGGVTKLVLRNAMRDLLPASISQSHLKVYIEPPFRRWLKGALQPMARSMLLTGKSYCSEFLNPDMFRNTVSRVLDGQATTGWEEQFVWRILILEIWLRMFFGDLESQSS